MGSWNWPVSDSGVLEGEKARKEVDTGERNCQPAWLLCSGSNSEASRQPMTQVIVIMSAAGSPEASR